MCTFPWRGLGARYTLRHFNFFVLVARSCGCQGPMAEAPRRCQSDGLDVRLGSPPVLACVWILSLVLSVGIDACVDR